MNGRTDKQDALQREKKRLGKKRIKRCQGKGVKKACRTAPTTQEYAKYITPDIIADEYKFDEKTPDKVGINETR